MQDILLTNVLRWPMELFDTTPVGRVLNRFSKDVDTVDNVLPQVIRSWIMMFFAVKKKKKKISNQQSNVKNKNIFLLLFCTTLKCQISQLSSILCSIESSYLCDSF